MRAVVAIALAALVLVGCGAGRAVDDDILAEAAAQTLDAGSSRVTVRIVDPGSAEMNARAEVDYRAPKAHATFRVTASDDEGGDYVQDVILDRRVLYVKFENEASGFAKGKSWFKTELADSDDEMFGPFGKDPNDLLRFLRETSDVVHTGTAEVHGVAVEHYRGTLDLDRVIAKFPAEDRAAMREGLDDAAPTLRKDGLPIEFWIDEQGFLRRVRLEVAQKKKKKPAIATVEFFDFGIDVDVSPPPPDQVMDPAHMFDFEEGEEKAEVPPPTPAQEKCFEEADDETEFERCFEQAAPQNGGER